MRVYKNTDRKTCSRNEYNVSVQEDIFTDVFPHERVCKMLRGVKYHGVGWQRLQLFVIFGLVVFKCNSFLDCCIF